MEEKVSKKQQPALTVQEQIDNLKSLGLIVSNEAYANAFLNDVSYFRFIKAYSLGLKPHNRNYYSGVSFEQLASLYHFNANLRSLLFPQIEKIEINLRCRIANYFSLKYGVLGYKDSQNFAFFPDTLINEINREIKRNRQTPFIRNFQQNYENGEIPFYALVEIFSFGMLSKFYKNMKNCDKKQIAQSYNVPYTYLESWFESIAYVRNICAHYGRLYNAKFSKKPRLFKQDSALGIPNNCIMGTLICLKYLLPDKHNWLEFVDTLELLFERCPYAKLSTMGFPKNWKKILL